MQDSSTCVESCSRNVLASMMLYMLLLQAKAGRKFKYTGKGTVETLTVTYCASSKIAKGSGTWAFSDVA